MILRKAAPADAGRIAQLLFLAMTDIVYAFMGEKNKIKAIQFLEYFVDQPANQYSYENCLVAEENQVVIAVLNAYDGAYLQELRRPIAQYFDTHFQLNFSPENETEAGEWYIDTLGVDPRFQGKGVGSNLLKFLIDLYVVQQRQTLGLLVEEGNPDAKRLYLKLGFEVVGQKKLMGKRMHHLQLRAVESHSALPIEVKL